MESDIMLEAVDIHKVYSNAFGRNKTVALKGVNLKLKERQSMGIVGSSGTGKSSLVKILLKLIKKDRGEVYFKGVNIDSFNRKEMLEFRRGVQFISQRPEESFDPRIKIEDSIREVVFLLNKTKKFQEELYFYMNKFDLRKELLNRYPHQISGGEVQRFSICRSLLVNPKVIIFDEATSMLDVSNQAKIINVLKSIQEEKNLSYIFISHDRVLINKICDEIIYITK